MVIQLTKGELAILEMAALGRCIKLTKNSPVEQADLRLLIDMQLILEDDGKLQITLIGHHVLKHSRSDPPR
jgi:hypothetical protein